MAFYWTWQFVWPSSRWSRLGEAEGRMYRCGIAPSMTAMSPDAARSEPIVDYFAWLQRLVPAVAADPRPPAAEADSAAVEARIGFALPAKVRAMYLLHDRQHSVGE